MPVFENNFFPFFFFLRFSGCLVKVEVDLYRRIYPWKKFLNILNVQERVSAMMQFKNDWICSDIINLRKKRLVGREEKKKEKLFRSYVFSRFLYLFCF